MVEISLNQNIQHASSNDGASGRDMRRWQGPASSSRRARRGRKVQEEGIESRRGRRGQELRRESRHSRDGCKYSLGESDDETLDILRGSTLIDETLTEQHLAALTEQHLAADTPSSNPFEHQAETPDIPEPGIPQERPSDSISWQACKRSLTDKEQKWLATCEDVAVLKQMLNSSKKCEELENVVKKQDMLLYELVSQNMQLKDEIHEFKTKSAGSETRKTQALELALATSNNVVSSMKRKIKMLEEALSQKTLQSEISKKIANRSRYGSIQMGLIGPLCLEKTGGARAVKRSQVVDERSKGTA
eukprot:768766-Hanusia_phi.AAC.12